MSDPHKSRWYQFSLRTLLIVMLLFTVSVGGWVHYRQYRAQQKQKEMTAAWLQEHFGERTGFGMKNPGRGMTCVLTWPDWPDDDGETPKQDSPRCEILP